MAEIDKIPPAERSKHIHIKQLMEYAGESNAIPDMQITQSPTFAGSKQNMNVSQIVRPSLANSINSDQNNITSSQEHGPSSFSQLLANNSNV